MKQCHRLCRLALAAFFALSISGCAEKYSTISKRSARAFATTPGQKSMLAAAKPFAKQPLTQIGRYLDAADAARLVLAAQPSDPGAQSDYNFAVARVIEIIEDNDLTPWLQPIVCTSATGNPWSLKLTPLGINPNVTPANFVILPADRYNFKGKLVGEHRPKQGLGAPIIAASKGVDFTKFDEFAQGDRIYYGLTAAIRFEGRNCEVVLNDPLSQETLLLDGHTYPLAADFHAPLALSLADQDMKKKELSAFFKPSEHVGTARLSRLQPYDPAKIPVLFIHGLTNSQATWMPMIDSLRNDATIRANYQFWVFNYPSGLPYPMPTAQLRRQLDRIRELYPNHKDIVVVGHSMGGMISRLLIADSGTALWDTAFDKPLGEMGFDAHTQKMLGEMLIFKARPDISRVIYASASHRGSEDATGFMGRLGAKLVGKPFAGDVIDDDVVAASRHSSERGRAPNAIDVLDPDSPFLKAVDTLSPKPGIPFHSIIGDRGKGGNLNHTKPVSTDGIVPYWSSHLDGARSELIIPSEHWTILHPQGIAEVNRILHLHLGQN